MMTLFLGNSLSSYLKNCQQVIINHINQLDPTLFFNTCLTNLKEEMYNQHYIQSLKVFWDKAEQLPPIKTNKEVYRYNRKIFAPFTRIEIVMPFQGNQDLVFLQHSSYKTIFPHGTIHNKNVHLKKH